MSAILWTSFIIATNRVCVYKVRKRAGIDQPGCQWVGPECNVDALHQGQAAEDERDDQAHDMGVCAGCPGVRKEGRYDQGHGGDSAVKPHLA